MLITRDLISSDWQQSEDNDKAHYMCFLPVYYLLHFKEDINATLAVTMMRAFFPLLWTFLEMALFFPLILSWELRKTYSLPLCQSNVIP